MNPPQKIRLSRSFFLKAGLAFVTGFALVQVFDFFPKENISSERFSSSGGSLHSAPFTTYNRSSLDERKFDLLWQPQKEVEKQYREEVHAYEDRVEKGLRLLEEQEKKEKQEAERKKATAAQKEKVATLEQAFSTKRISKPIPQKGKRPPLVSQEKTGSKNVLSENRKALPPVLTEAPPDPTKERSETKKWEGFPEDRLALWQPSAQRTVASQKTAKEILTSVMKYETRTARENTLKKELHALPNKFSTLPLLKELEAILPRSLQYLVEEKKKEVIEEGR